jgi:Lar family restriction alleviation protein
MSNEIHDCPFCGSANIAIGYAGQPAVSFFMKCVDCGAAGPACYSSMPTGGSAPADLLEKWNARALAAKPVKE